MNLYDATLFIVSSMKTEMFIGFVTVMCLVGGVNYIAKEFCTKFCWKEPENKNKIEQNPENDQHQQEQESKEDPIEQRVYHLEQSFKELSEKKEELLLLHEQLIQIKHVLESLKQRIPVVQHEPLD